MTHVARTFERVDGGPAEVLRELLPALSGLGVEVAVVTADSSGSLASRRLEAVADVRRVKLIGTRRLAYPLGLAQQLLRPADIPPVVHIHGLTNVMAQVAISACRRARLAYVIQPHGAIGDIAVVRSAVRRWLLRSPAMSRRVADAAAIIVSSERERRAVLRDFPQARVEMVPLGVADDLHRIERRTVRGQAGSVFLFLGRIDASKKRASLVVAAFALSSPSDGDRLIFAGPVRNATRKALGRQAQSLGVGDNVEFVGIVDRSARAELLEIATALVLPSEDESFGLAVAEAIVAGVPVIASGHVGVLEDLASEGLVEPTAMNARAFASGMASAADCDASARRRTHMAREVARQRYTWARVAGQLEQVYLQARDR